MGHACFTGMPIIVYVPVSLSSTSLANISKLNGPYAIKLMMHTGCTKAVGGNAAGMTKNCWKEAGDNALLPDLLNSYVI